MARDEEFDGHKFVGQVVAFLAAIPAIAVLLTLHALVLYKFWGWFVVPVFPSLPQPTLLQCYGLWLVVGLIKMKSEAPRKKTEEEKAEAKRREPGTWESIAFGLWMNGFILLAGWLIHRFVIGSDPTWLNTLLGM